MQPSLWCLMWIWEDIYVNTHKYNTCIKNIDEPNVNHFWPTPFWMINPCSKNIHKWFFIIKTKSIFPKKIDSTYIFHRNVIFDDDCSLKCKKCDLIERLKVDFSFGRVCNKKNIMLFCQTIDFISQHFYIGVRLTTDTFQYILR